MTPWNDQINCAFCGECEPQWWILNSSIGTECFLYYQAKDGSNTDRHPQCVVPENIHVHPKEG